jgi:hypothetical protein
VRLAALLVLLLPSASLAQEPSILRSARSGNWSDPATWVGNAVPGAGSRVLVRAGHAVTYDARSDAVIRGLNVSGSVVFATDRDTVLNVGLIKLQAGDEYSEDGFDCDHTPPADPKAVRPELVVGTPERPVAAGKTALIRLHYVAGMDKDKCPAVVNCGGRMDLHGQPLSRAWVRLGATVKVGDSAVTLSEPVTGWKAGDRVIVTGTNTHGPAKSQSTTEERTIVATGTRSH